jgi:chromate transporter
LSSAADHPQDRNTPSYTLWQLVLYVLKLGTIGVRGPVALVGVIGMAHIA